MSSHERTLLSVIVPAYRCKTIVHDLKAIDGYLQDLKVSYELLCVVDGASSGHDSTEALAMKARTFGVKVFSYEINQGKGYAVRYGMARAQGSLIAFIDAGNDLNASGLGMAMEHMRWYGADVIIGSKRHPASKVDYPVQRRVLSWIVQRGTKWVFGFNVSDTQTGLKLFRREVLEDVLPRLLVKRWAFDVEMLAVIWRLGYRRIYESPVEIHFNAMSTITWKSIVQFATDYLAIIYRIYILGYYDDAQRSLWHQDKSLRLKKKLV